MIPFQPRPDNLELGDQQQSFYDSQDRGISFLLKGCGSGGTTIALEKVLKFLNDNPPPQPQCEFWILHPDPVIAGNQLFLRDYERRLIEHDNGMHWRIRLMSSESVFYGGSQAAGFAFLEELPSFETLMEVLRATRNWDFYGNKFCEFTPLQDPAKPYEKCFLQIMEETNTLPDGWKIYHASTEAAMRAGNISQQWFDAFFSLSSASEKQTLNRGQWPPEVECPTSL